MWTPTGLGTPGRRVDFIGVDVHGECFVDGLIKAGEQLGEACHIP